MASAACFCYLLLLRSMSSEIPSLIQRRSFAVNRVEDESDCEQIPYPA